MRSVTQRGCSSLRNQARPSGDGRRAQREDPTCPPGHPHNSWCYNSHGCKCDSCRRSWALARKKNYRKNRVKRKEPVLIGAAPIVRRLRALAVIGYGLGELSQLLNANRSNLAEIRRGERRTVHIPTAEKIVELYRRIYLTPSGHPNARLIAERARAAGYLSPLHWADIDRGITEEVMDE